MNLRFEPAALAEADVARERYEIAANSSKNSTEAFAK